MNRVKKAIIMAAGKGNRLRPLTNKIPKPLIKVNGKAMIETIIEGLIFNGIYEIYIVVGYLKEKFKYLENKYNNIKIIENPYYSTCNNISSLYVAREYIGDSFIIDGDQIIYNSKILNPEYILSGYNSVYVNSYTNEWVQEVKDGLVTSCSRTGGDNGWQLYSISRWSKEDGNRLKRHLEIEFEVNMNRDIYWDDVVMFLHKEDYKLCVYEMDKNDIVEIDSLKELVEIDGSYKYLLEGLE